MQGAKSIEDLEKLKNEDEKRLLDWIGLEGYVMKRKAWAFNWYSHLFEAYGDTCFPPEIFEGLIEMSCPVTEHLFREKELYCKTLEYWYKRRDKRGWE